MAERLVIIGGVAAGMSAAAKARRIRRDLEIIVYERSGHVSYGACGFPYFIKGEIHRIEDLIVRTPEEFAKSGITVHVRHEVTAIDTVTRTVRVRDLARGREFVDGYDALILAAGGSPTRPPIPGRDLPGVFTLRSVEEAVAIRNWLDDVRPRRGVIVGGGYIGLEMAEALAAHGVALTVVEQLPQLLPNLDAAMAGHVQAELARQGVAVRLESPVTAFVGDERVRQVHAGGEVFPTDIVIFSVGVRPNAALAADAGIALGPTGAVAVDAHQRTSAPGVWAAGDVAEALHLVTGKPAYVPLGTTANKQGRVAGTNAAGGDATFGGIVGTAVVKVFDVTAASTGLSQRRALAEGFDAETVVATAGSRAHYMPGHTPVHVALVIERGTRRLLGGQIVGQEGVAKRIDTLAAALQAHWGVADLAALDLSYAPPFAPVWDPILVAANLAAR
ncbi:MAG TPA: FAD-dependent oxidoreductase [Roseiflexaceae bacterium]|nr:FAD-dependent oxidoreductase [Roseiflexaceae bacterium]